MRRAVLGGTLLLALVAGLSLPVGAQQISPVINVSQSPGTSRHPHLAVDGAGTLHVAWADDSGGTPGVTQIWYNRSFDGGNTFTPATRISTGLQASLRPRLAVIGPAVFLVWMQDPDGAQESNTKEVMFARSLDGGASFSEPVDLSNTPGNSLEARVAVNASGTVFVVWDEESPTRHIAITRSFDGGATFETPRALAPVSTPPGCAPGAVGNCVTVYPGVAVDPASGRVYVVWHDLVGAQPQVLFSRSLDAGATFSVPQNISHAGIHAHCASISVGPSGRILVGFESRKTLAVHTHDAMVTQSTDGGASFSPPVDVSHSPEWAVSDYPYPVEGPGGVIVVGWEDNGAGGSEDAVVAVSTDGGLTFGPPIDLSNNPDSDSTEIITLFAPDGTFYIVWEDYSLGAAEVFLRHARGAAPPPPPPPAPPPPPPPVQPTITSPAGGATLHAGDVVAFAWTEVPGAVLYGLEFTGADRSFANPNDTGPDPVNGFGGAGGGLLVAGPGLTGILPPVPAATYQFRVMGLTATLQPVGRFSDARAVVIATLPPPPPPPGGGGGGDDCDRHHRRRRC